jgi:hypothetical protein
MNIVPEDSTIVIVMELYLIFYPVTTAIPAEHDLEILLILGYIPKDLLYILHI